MTKSRETYPRSAGVSPARIDREYSRKTQRENNGFSPQRTLGAQKKTVTTDYTDSSTGISPNC